MKRPLKFIVVFFSAVAIGLAALHYPKFSNMASEYGTGSAVRLLTDYVLENEGKWPGSPGDLNNAYPAGCGVSIDYSMTAEQLRENPDKLKEAVRPDSGKFYTYPHYQRDLDQLLRALKSSRADRLAKNENFKMRISMMGGVVRTKYPERDVELFQGWRFKLGSVIHDRDDHLKAVSEIPGRLLKDRKISETVEYHGWFYSSIEHTSWALQEPSWFQVIGSKQGDDHLYFSHTW